jgi:hypothetical protein
MGNAYMERQKQMQQYYFDQGAAVGFQRCLDYMQALLHNPEYVGRDVFGRKRWEILYKGLKVCDETFGDAFTMGVNADYCQEKLDTVIRDIFGADALTFAERYPMVKAQRYDKAKKGWV